MLSSQMPNKMARPQMPQKCLSSDGDLKRPLSQMSTGTGTTEIHAQKIPTESKIQMSDENNDVDEDCGYQFKKVCKD